MYVGCHDIGILGTFNHLVETVGQNSWNWDDPRKIYAEEPASLS